ncbi:MAG: glycosyltransferase family 4 protein [Chloroflexi bacterium]|nr:glycosyltransferase family 4 protein [Chloroflexota bacterium]
MTRTLFVVSANLPDGIPPQGDGPKKDYAAIAERLGADLLDWSAARGNPVLRLLSKVAGRSATQALLAFLRRRHYDVILTDGEHIGIPLALLLKLASSKKAHVTIGHRLSTSKKRPFFKWLRVQTHMSAVVLHSRFQYDLALDELGFSKEQLALLPYQVDPDFWHPMDVPEERLVTSAGLEYRDYPTLFQAVDGLDVKLVVGASSHWSKRRNTALDAPRPANVEVSSFNYRELRDLFARAAIVAVPVDDVDFQAGVTTILEAMAMGKPVIVTHTYGQTDVIHDRRLVTRGNGNGGEDRDRPISLLHDFAEEEGVPLEPNGFYVPPKDPGALHRAIAFLLENPEHRRQLGEAGRRTVEHLMSVNQFAERIARVIELVRTPQQGRPPLSIVPTADPLTARSRGRQVS